MKLIQLGVSNSTFMRQQLLSKAIGAIMLPYEVRTILKYLVNRKLSFPVTPKSETTLSLRETLYISKETILIMALLAAGLTFVNPLGIVYNITWLTPFSASPIVIYFFSKAMSVDNKRSVVDPQTTLTNGASFGLTCHHPQPETVSLLLNSMGTMH